jgi:DNA-binding FadR family transcriptional regulator
VRETQAEHRAILDELVRHDPERARIRMSVHLLGVEEFSAAHADEDPEAN